MIYITIVPTVHDVKRHRYNLHVAILGGIGVPDEEENPVAPQIDDL